MAAVPVACQKKINEEIIKEKLPVASVWDSQTVNPA